MVNLLHRSAVGITVVPAELVDSIGLMINLLHEPLQSCTV